MAEFTLFWDRNERALKKRRQQGKQLSHQLCYCFTSSAWRHSDARVHLEMTHDPPLLSTNPGVCTSRSYLGGIGEYHTFEVVLRHRCEHAVFTDMPFPILSFPLVRPLNCRLAQY